MPTSSNSMMSWVPCCIKNPAPMSRLPSTSRMLPNTEKIPAIRPEIGALTVPIQPNGKACAAKSTAWIASNVIERVPSSPFFGQNACMVTCPSVPPLVCTLTPSSSPTSSASFCIDSLPSPSSHTWPVILSSKVSDRASPDKYLIFSSKGLAKF